MGQATVKQHDVSTTVMPRVKKSDGSNEGGVIKKKMYA
jgi:hypothetical protein